MINAKYKNLMAIGVSLLILMGCNDNDNDPIPNIAITEVSAPERGIYTLGEPFSIDYSVQVTDVEADNIGVVFYLVSDVDYDLLVSGGDPTEYKAGTAHIETLVEGETTYSVDLFVPNDLVEEGEYYVVAYADSTYVIDDEANTDDNLSRGFDTSDEVSYSTMIVDLDAYNDFEVTNLEIGKGYLLLPDLEDYDETDTGAPATLGSNLIGFIDAIKYGSSVSDAELTGTLSINDTDYQAYFWHLNDNSYSTNVPIDFPNHAEVHFQGWDVALNGEQTYALSDAYDENIDENTFELTIEIVNTSGITEESEDNNSLTISVPYFVTVDNEDEMVTSTKIKGARSEKVTTTSDTLTVTNDYSETYGDDSKIAIDLDFSNEMILDGSSFDASLTASADFDISIFDNSASLISASLDADATTDSASYDIEVEVLGNSVYSKSDEADVLVAEIFESPWDEDITLFESTFTIIIIPVTVKAGVSGILSYSTSLSFTDGVIIAEADIVNAAIDAYASASIDVVLYEVGVEADFVIISDIFAIAAQADLSDAIADSEMTLSLTVTNDLEAISGDFYAFLKYTEFKWCCSFKTEEDKYTIYDTDALYDKEWTMLDVSKTLEF